MISVKAALIAWLPHLLDKWAKDNGVFFKRVSSERFIAVFNEHILQQLEKGKFSILDEIGKRQPSKMYH